MSPLLTMDTYEGTAAAGRNTVTLTGLPGGTYNATITATADDYDNYTSAKDITVSISPRRVKRSR